MSIYGYRNLKPKKPTQRQKETKMTTDADEVISTIIEEEYEQPPEDIMSLADLNSLYNKTKAEDTAQSSKLTSNFTLKGMDEVKEMVASAMMQIEEFTNKGKEQGIVSATTSKALALVDSKNKWIGKWFNGKVDASKRESIEQSTVSEIVTSLKNNVEVKRNEVIDLIEDLTNIRLSMIERLDTYNLIDAQVTKLVETTEPSTRKRFDAQQLATMTKATIQKIESDIKSMIEPLIASATISVQQIQQLMPTIENDLQSKLSIKAFQQQLQDLNEIVKATTDLSKEVGSKVTASTRETIYQSISMLSETGGIDTKALQQSANEEVKHQEKIASLMKKTSEKINQNYNDMIGIQKNLIESKSRLSDNLISQYSEGLKPPKDD